jgi:hypothetical protein
VGVASASQKTRFTHNDTPNRFAVHDLGAAAVLITLQASALGLATHQMAGFDQAKARAIFAIPEDLRHRIGHGPRLSGRAVHPVERALPVAGRDHPSH